jgi:predicted membrane channel-forming protein YqfA (hemolysin III family)
MQAVFVCRFKDLEEIIPLCRKRGNYAHFFVLLGSVCHMMAVQGVIDTM